MGLKNRKKMIVGNFKMNSLPSELKNYFEIFFDKPFEPLLSRKIEVGFALPYLSLDRALAIRTKKNNFEIYAQNIHQEISGAYTGEVSVAMLKDIGVDGTLVGHSERRQYFAESNSLVASKVQLSLKENFSTLLCVGESLENRQNGSTFSVLSSQLEPLFQEMSKLEEKLILAYEPVWAIGTGLSATEEQAEEVHKFLRNCFAKKYGEEPAARLTILYGGSVKVGNVAALMAQPNIDGALVGGACLSPSGFRELVDLAAQAV